MSKCSIELERWDYPIFLAEPSGFDHIEVVLTEPSCKVEVKATISLSKACDLAQRLLALCNGLREGGEDDQ